MNLSRVDHFVAFPMEEECPGPVSRTRQRWGVALCFLGTLAGGAGILVAGSPDWLLNWGVMLGFGGLWCLGAFWFGTRRDLRKLYAGKGDAFAGPCETEGKS
ncbi:MAG: hypothetical protein M3480_01215 [Verrucomicrobiota bacterium]|nr:hypothetical protein [Verrucomicrobiota bacterium]